jgi:hypothetical protein
MMWSLLKLIAAATYNVLLPTIVTVDVMMFTPNDDIQ